MGENTGKRTDLHPTPLNSY